MNLLLLAVWCGLLLSCTVSLPRRRQVKFPVTKFQNSYHERSHPTALEVLERTLLRPSDRKRRHSHPRSGGKRSAQFYSEDSSSPLYSKSAGGDISETREDRIDSCVASFGDQSPLCKPRKRQKKSFVGIPDLHKRLFRSDTGGKNNMTITTVDDFFGIFKSSNAPISNDISPLVTTPLNKPVTSSIPTSKSATIESTTPVAATQMATSQQSPLQPTGESVKASSIDSVDAVSKNEASKIILPGSVQKIESETQFLFVEGDDSAKNDPKAESYTKAIEETDGNIETAAETIMSEEPMEEITTEIEPTTLLTLPPLMKSFLTGATYSKATCESEKGTKCICSFSSVDSDFQTIFSKAKLAEEIMVEIASMKCRRYTPKPAVFDLNTNSKPRVLKGKHTPFAIDNRQGAKEVTEKSLDEFIVYSALEDGITRVFVSSDVKIPCFPKPDIHLSATDADHVKYTWTFGNKKQTITQGRITEDDDGDGSLNIEDIELTDAMNYTCEIDYIHPDTGERTTDTFVHSLSVVTLPIVSARARVHYKSTAACDESLLEMFEMYLPQQMEKALCAPGNDRPQLCSVVIHSPVCHTESQVTAEERSKREASESLTYWYREKREGSMEMSLNFDVFIHRPGTKVLPGDKAKLCDPDCHLLINFKLLQLLRESAQEAALIPITSKVQGGGTFTPVPSSVKVKYIFGCIGGYYLDNGFCLACPKGTYSDDGATECQHCPLHTYSGSVGTRRCTPCKYLWMPICNEHFESINILMIVYVVGIVVLLLAGFVIYYVFWYKGQTWKEIIKKGPKEKIAKSERIRSRKEAKLEKQEREAESKKAEKEAKKHVKIKEEEMKRLLQSSGESGTESEPEQKSK